MALLTGHRDFLYKRPCTILANARSRETDGLGWAADSTAACSGASTRQALRSFPPPRCQYGRRNASIHLRCNAKNSVPMCDRLPPQDLSSRRQRTPPGLGTSTSPRSCGRPVHRRPRGPPRRAPHRRASDLRAAARVGVVNARRGSKTMAQLMPATSPRDFHCFRIDT